MIEDVITGMHLGVRKRVIAAGPVPGAPRSPPAPQGSAGTDRKPRASGKGWNPGGWGEARGCLLVPFYQ